MTTDKKESPLEESLKNLQQEYNQLCGNIGHLLVQNLYNDKEREKLTTEVMTVIRKSKTLKDNQPIKKENTTHVPGTTSNDTTTDTLPAQETNEQPPEQAHA